MAISVNFSRFIAALAAMFTLTLTACGGGEADSQQTAAQQAAAQAFTGPAVSQPLVLDLQAARKRMLSEQEGHSASFSVGSGGVISPAEATQVAMAPTEYTNAALLDWAQVAYPELFSGAPLVFDEVIAPDGNRYYARYYAVTGNYVGVCLGGSANTCIVGGAYGLGPYTGNVLAYFGHKDAYKCLVNAEWCRPRVVSVTPASGATGVDIKNVTIKVVFDRQLVCHTGSIPGTFGLITGMLTCTNAVSTAEVVIVATTLPDNSRITASLSGFRSAEGGIEMAAYTWSFTTRKGIVTVLETKVLTANLLDMGREVGSIIDASTNEVTKKVEIPQVPGYLLPNHVHVDPMRSVGYLSVSSGFVLYRFNPSTGEVLPPFLIEDKIYWNERVNGTQGVASSASEVCIVTGGFGVQSIYTHRNRLICFHPDTGARTFVSPTDFLGTVAEVPTNLLYSTSRQKYYVLMATENCLLFEGVPGGARDGYCAGSTGRLVEINAVTKVRERSWSVGSMPLNAAFIGDQLYVLKSGDRGATIVNLVTGATQSIDWSNLFGQYAYPTNIQPDEEKGVYYVSDWKDSVRVMSLATNQQIGAITLPAGRVPRGMVIADGDLWVATPLRDMVYTDAQSVVRIDRKSRTIKKMISLGPVPDTRIGLGPWDIAVYERIEVR